MLRTGTILFVLLAMALSAAGPLAGRCAAQEKPAAKAVSVVPKADLGTKTTCAVCGMKLTVDSTTPAAEYEGKNYYFCSSIDRDTFLKDPAKFAQAKH